LYRVYSRELEYTTRFRRSPLSEITLEQAQDIMSHVVSQKVRWGNMYDGSDVGVSKMLDALIVLAKEDTAGASEARASLATANRQLGAAKARETKDRKQIETLKAEVDSLTRLVERLSEKGLTDDQETR